MKETLEYLQGTEKDNKEIAEHIEKLQKEYDIEMKEEKQEKEKTEQVEKEEQIFPKKCRKNLHRNYKVCRISVQIDRRWIRWKIKAMKL